ncbi:MAG: class I SAM-dependent methyltransferase [Proteobacteria bacterium]|nr:class I SAM-dependent methyltransferase [Pseudomonadota bacterium]MBU4384638.1 class I SAM-dependent methyltransferase [Pseudomonadota bacterium]MCG2766214.1 class I SAM-dependent methyltransferase [Desulfarculaceae bacterium]
MVEEKFKFSKYIREKCPVCLSANTRMIGKKESSATGIVFSIARCDACESAFVVDPIHPAHLDQIYSSDYFSGKGLDSKANYLDNIHSGQKYFFEKYDWQIGSEIFNQNIGAHPNWLDIGCALGNTLDWAKNRFDANTYGIELSSYAAKFASDRGHIIIGKNIEEETVENYYNFFNIVTCYEVMEHLYDPVIFTRRVANLLKEGGLFHYSTSAPPNDADMLDWHYLRPEVHITFYSSKGIKILFNNCGMDPKIRIRKYKVSTLEGFKYYDPYKTISARAVKIKKLMMRIPFVDYGLSCVRPRLPIGFKKK